MRTLSWLLPLILAMALVLVLFDRRPAPTAASAMPVRPPGALTTADNGQTAASLPVASSVEAEMPPPADVTTPVERDALADLFAWADDLESRHQGFADDDPMILAAAQLLDGRLDHLLAAYAAAPVAGLRRMVLERVGQRLPAAELSEVLVALPEHPWLTPMLDRRNWTVEAAPVLRHLLAEQPSAMIALAVESLGDPADDRVLSDVVALVTSPWEQEALLNRLAKRPGCLVVDIARRAWAYEAHPDPSQAPLLLMAYAAHAGDASAQLAWSDLQDQHPELPPPETARTWRWVDLSLIVSRPPVPGPEAESGAAAAMTATGAWIDEVLAKAPAGEAVHADQDAGIQALSGIPTEAWTELLRAKSRHRDFAAQVRLDEAMIRSVRPEHQAQVLASLPDHPVLMRVIADQGWQTIAAPAIRRWLLRGQDGRYLGHAVEAVACLADANQPQDHELLRQVIVRMSYGYHQQAMAEHLRRASGFPWAATVRAAWRHFPVARYGDRQEAFALTAAQAGSRDALRVVVAIASGQGTTSWGHDAGPTGHWLITIGAPDDPTQLASWFTACEPSLRSDEATGQWLGGAAPATTTAPF